MYIGARLLADEALERRRSGDLLRFLLLQPEYRATRDQVIDQLWTDINGSNGVQLLHQATSNLRRVFEPDLPDYNRFAGLWMIRPGRFAARVGPFDGAAAARHGAACVGAQDQAELVEGAGIIFPPPANIANPGREVRYGDQLVCQPGEVGDILQVHLTRRTFIARNGRRA